MKSIIYYIAFFCIVSLFSCTKNNEVDLIVGDPKERINDTIAMLKSTLVGAPYGWKAAVSTDVGKEFNFYMKFNEDDRMLMYSDVNANAAVTSKESTYRVRQIMAATLVFDTYNYITILQDPNGAVNGGKNGVGLGSDVEYEYLHRNGDTIVFKGRKFDEPLVLIKATEAEKKRYEEQEYLNSIQNIVDKFGLLDGQIVTVNNKKYNISVNESTKQFTLIHVTSDGKSEITNGFYSYTLDGLQFLKGIKVDGVNLKGINEASGKFTLLGEGNQKFDIVHDPNSTLPVEMVYGFDKSIRTFGSRGNNNLMPTLTEQTTFDNIIAGITTKFGTVKFRYYTFNFESRTKLSINVYYTSSADFVATMTVDYVFNNGEITLSNPTGNTSGNWNTRRAVLREFEDYILNNKTFKVEWVKTTEGASVIGWRSVSNPNNLIYGFPI